MTVRVDLRVPADLADAADRAAAAAGLTIDEFLCRLIHAAVVAT